jgi:hypothetical protein
MAPTGYTDWQRVNYANGQLLFNINAFVKVARTDGPFNVQAWNSVAVQLFTLGTSDSYKVDLNWYADAAKAVQLATDTVLIGQDYLAQIPIPVLGPYLFVTITPKAGNNASIVQFSFYGQSQTPTEFDMGSFDQPFLASVTAYAINAALIFQTTAIYSGNAYLNAQAGSVNTCDIAVQYYDWTTNAFITYLDFTAVTNTNKVNQLIPMMATPTQIVVTNGGTAQSIRFGLFANR